ncbi:hypothetical protein BG015_000601, partial [Linnemannia schmuckeri]
MAQADIRPPTRQTPPRPHLSYSILPHHQALSPRQVYTTHQLANAFLFLHLLLVHLLLVHSHLPVHTNSSIEKFFVITDPYPTFTDNPETLPSDGQRPSRARIIDVVPVNDELDMLEVRMEELDSVVDLFVIVESEFTFMLKPTPLYFRRNKDRFKKVVHKTLALFVHEMSWESRDRTLHEKLHDITWASEAHEHSLGMWVALKESGATTEDRITYSDLDKILRKDVIAALHGVDSDREGDRSYRSGPEQSLKVLSQPQLPAPLSPPTQEQQQQEVISSPEHPAKKSSTATEMFENFKDKDLAYYENWVRAANCTVTEIKMH